MAGELLNYHVWDFPTFTSEETDSPGQYCCTGRGLFKLSTETIELNGYTFGIFNMVLQPVDEETEVIGISPTTEEVYNTV